MLYSVLEDLFERNPLQRFFICPDMVTNLNGLDVVHWAEKRISSFSKKEKTPIDAQQKSAVQQNRADTAFLKAAPFPMGSAITPRKFVPKLKNRFRTNF